MIDLGAARDLLRKAEADGLTENTIIPVTLRWLRQALAELAEAQFSADRALDLVVFKPPPPPELRSL